MAKAEHALQYEQASTIAAYPTEGQAQLMFGEADVERLWDAVGKAVRLDENDPVAAWKAHTEKLQSRCRVLDEQPVLPACQPVNGIVALDFVHRQLVALTVEVVLAIDDAVWPGQQRPATMRV